MKRQLSTGNPTTPPKKRRQNSQVNEQQAVRTTERKESRFPYGNSQIDRWPDEAHLNRFHKDWFENRDVLDVGCNAGFFTLAVALVFRPANIVGIDIDRNLINAARKNLSVCQQMMQEQKLRRRRDSLGAKPSSDYNIFPVSMIHLYGPISTPNFSFAATSTPNSTNLGFCRSVDFRCENYVLDNDDDLGKIIAEYDTIMALNVTKWVHLKRGDDGLKRFFKRAFAQLRPGGYFILEPQPWITYSRCLKYKQNMDLRLKPGNFVEYLRSDEVGFAKHHVVHLDRDNRALILFEKAKV